MVVWQSRDPDGSDTASTASATRRSPNPDSVGDPVWNDLNANGTQDAGEPGLEGVEVTVFSGTGAMAGRALTDGDGRYTFNKPAPRRAARPALRAPAGYAISPLRRGGPTRDSDIDPATGRTMNFSSPPGGSNPNMDAGFYPAVNVAGRVWVDANSNGVRDGGEAGRDGVNVRLINALPYPS